MKVLTLEKSKELLKHRVQSENLKRHCFAVGKVLRALRKYYIEIDTKVGNLSEDEWEIIGNLHDMDYEETKDSPELHTVVLLNWLEEFEVSGEILSVFRSHNTKITGLRNPETLLEWSLECCDELTGFIVAVALVKPSKKLVDVSMQNVLDKLKQKEFARAVHREQIFQCEEKLGLKLEKLVEVVLNAMKENSDLLGL